MGRGTSKASANISNAGVTTDQEKTLAKIAKKTANLKNEQYRIIDEEGNVVLEKRGGQHEVATTVGEKRQFADGAVTIHNHPNGGTFSSADMSDFGYGARQIAVSTPEGMYTLTNANYGEKGYRGNKNGSWVNLRDGMQKIDEIESNVSFTERRKKVMESPQVKKLQAESTKIANTWLKRRSEGASASELEGYMKQSDAVGAKLKSAIQAETRRLEVKPYHDYLKKNAKKYGYVYSYPKGK